MHCDIGHYSVSPAFPLRLFSGVLPGVDCGNCGSGHGDWTLGCLVIVKSSGNLFESVENWGDFILSSSYSKNSTTEASSEISTFGCLVAVPRTISLKIAFARSISMTSSRLIIYENKLHLTPQPIATYYISLQQRSGYFWWRCGELHSGPENSLTMLLRAYSVF